MCWLQVTRGLLAEWDDAPKEYAWHEVGTQIITGSLSSFSVEPVSKEKVSVSVTLKDYAPGSAEESAFALWATLRDSHCNEPERTIGVIRYHSMDL